MAPITHRDSSLGMYVRAKNAASGSRFVSMRIFRHSSRLHTDTIQTTLVSTVLTQSTRMETSVAFSQLAQQMVPRQHQ